MARLLIPITEITTEEHLPAAVVPAYVTGLAADDLRLDSNDGHVVVEIHNLDGAASHAAVFNALGLYPLEHQHEGGTPPGGAVEIEDLTVTVPAAGTVMVGNLKPAVFNTKDTGTPGDGGKVDINVDSDQLQFRAFHLPPIRSGT